jgi:PAS domain S-box-containing protein
MVGSINISRLRVPSTPLHYGLALLAVSAATLIQHFGDKHFAVTPSYFCAVLLIARFEASGAALFAIALSNFALMYYFVPPTRTFAIDIAYVPSLILFSLAALFVTWLSGRERSATKSLGYTREQLDLKIRELEKTNQALEAEITERKRAEKALRESEAKFRSAIDGIAGLVVVMGPDGALQAINRRVIEYFGRSLEEMNNWGQNDAVHPEDLPRIIEPFQATIAAGNPFQFELRMRRFDGEYRWFENRGVPIRDDSGRVERWYFLLVDIEDRTRALEGLQQLQSDFAHMNRVSMMGELAASLSHEITQPIASARNNACAAQNFLDMQPPDLDKVRKVLVSLVGNADRAGIIVDRIRDHVKKAPPRKAFLDLNHAIEEVIALAQTAITRNGVSLQTALAKGLAPVEGDRVQLQQVVLNLVLNAVEAMSSVEAGPRQLLIKTEENQAEGVLVTVRDSGPGIDLEYFERVFEAFYTTKSNGTGMGLSICRSIITAHDGRLWADANQPRGAAFQFTLKRGNWNTCGRIRSDRHNMCDAFKWT